MISQPSHLSRPFAVAPLSTRPSTVDRWRGLHITAAARADGEDYATGRIDVDELVARGRARYGLS